MLRYRAELWIAVRRDKLGRCSQSASAAIRFVWVRLRAYSSSTRADPVRRRRLPDGVAKQRNLRIGWTMRKVDSSFPERKPRKEFRVRAAVFPGTKRRMRCGGRSESEYDRHCQAVGALDATSGRMPGQKVLNSPGQ